jgi:hypothetical protein
MGVIIMRKIFFLFTLALSLMGIQAADIKPVTDALKTGNAEILKDKMATEVDIVVPGASKKGTGSEAITILKSFFQANKPTGFTVAHHADKNDSGFFVGKMAIGEKELRVNITYTTKDGKILITIIRIE